MRGLIAALVLALAVAGCGGKGHLPSPPVSAAALRGAIERGRGRIAFELAVTHGRAGLHALRHSRYPLRYDRASASRLIIQEFTKHEIDPFPRGVIANVAYATWWFSDPDDPRPPG